MQTMSSTKGKRPLLSAHEKVEAIRRVHDGESKASVARDIGVPESTLRGWCKNEDKILFLSRQSTPETSEGESDAKKMKYDSYPVTTTLPTTMAATIGLNYSLSNAQAQLSTSVLTDNLNAETKFPPGYDPKYNLLTTAAAMKNQTNEKRELSKRTLAERQRTRAELDRLSAELGLNRPEFGLLNVTGKQDQGINMSMLATSPLSNLNHLSGGSSHSASLGSSFQEIAAKVWNQVNQNAAVAAAAAKIAQNSVLNNKSPVSSKKSNIDPNNMGLNLIQKDLTPKKQNQQSPMTTSTPKSLTDDPMWFWLRAQQEMLNLAQTTQKLPTSQQQQSQTNNLVQQLQQFNNPDLKNNSSWFWKWYKQYYGFIPNLQQLQQNNGALDLATNENNILLQQLTKSNNEMLLNNQQQSTPPSHETSSTNNENMLIRTQDESLSPNKTPPTICEENNISLNNGDTKNPTKVRAVLDNLLTNNNNVMNNKSDDQQDVKENNEMESTLTPLEAIECGQKFLKWLESCSDPAVTAMQVIQFRLMLNNIKISADRKNNVQTSEKINRRK